MEKLMMRSFLISSYLLALSLALPVTAISGSASAPCAIGSCPAMSHEEATELLKPLKLKVKSVKLSPVKGMFEVLAERDGIDGLIYIDCAREHLMQGVIVNAKKMEIVSSHPIPKAPEKKATTSIDTKKIPIQYSLVLGNPNGNKRIYVFTDPDCPYCRTLHSELIKLEKMLPDLAIHIMLYPLPMHNQAYDKSRLLVSTKDINLLNKAFEGKELPKPVGDAGKAEIDKIIKFANISGISGTPTIVLPTGVLMTGAKNAESIKKLVTGQ